MLTETIEQRAKVNEHPRSNGAAGDGPRLPRGAAVSGRLVLPAPAKKVAITLLKRLRWLAQPRSATQETATGIQRLT